MTPRLVRRVHNRALRRSDRKAGVALVYHGVARRGGDARYELVPDLDAARFRAQLRRLQASYRPVRASDLVMAILERRHGEPFPVALTFDDDLPAHHETVAPMLLDRGVPATFFVCGWAIGSEAGPWWHDLQTVASQASAGLHLRSLPAVDLWAAIEQHPYSLHEAAERIEQLPPQERDAVAAELRSLASHLPPTLGADELRSLASNGFEIGFHTRRHYLLTTLSDGELARAMAEGRDELEPLAGRMSSIAYPHGKADRRVASAAREAGFALGFTAQPEAIGPGADNLLLGRIEVGTMTPIELSDAIDTAIARTPEPVARTRVSHLR